MPLGLKITKARVYPALLGTLNRGNFGCLSPHNDSTSPTPLGDGLGGEHKSVTLKTANTTEALGIRVEMYDTNL